MRNVVVKIQFYLYHYRYNQSVMEGKIQKRPNKGLNTNGNSISEDGNIMSIGEIQIIIQVTCNFLLYISIKKKIQDILKQQSIFI